jgi:hypothetical protein
MATGDIANNVRRVVDALHSIEYIRPVSARRCVSLAVTRQRPAEVENAPRRPQRRRAEENGARAARPPNHHGILQSLEEHC